MFFFVVKSKLIFFGMHGWFQKHADINHRKTANSDLSARAQDAQLHGGGVDPVAAGW